MKRAAKGILIFFTGAAVITAAVFVHVKMFRHVLINLVLIAGCALALTGILMVVFSIPKKDRSLDKTLEEIDGMEGKAFEDFLCLLFTEFGFTVLNTRRSHDFGADLILTDDSRKIVVQAKRYSKKVPIAAVQECSASRLHYKADEAWLVTNSYFTQSAQDLALTNAVRLISRNELAMMITEATKASPPPRSA